MFFVSRVFYISRFDILLNLSHSVKKSLAVHAAALVEWLMIGVIRPVPSCLLILLKETAWPRSEVTGRTGRSTIKLFATGERVFLQ